ncbi:3'(2'), 5'-bisphosphate nucleotidase [Galdieria sulphuraria]|uniref:3'(2'),5'-bisphosphate nucleotidase n=1 Tax=Galdieria sulphuraria TaxID=130081 RepID=M2Y5I2_GALSU|nr:3'(2'), 5'-bisphosphate nucleotidase [Galdieria sulphuraria]EME31114.1 3'(2'), 5'-bisphosphate nucleotidase [Galdieria sulphuraria]|eukprot:XP_005707634.1 3'(2'), 5'-bisphosphate nucleotidase [Galdieria sulphuraria]
MKGKDSLQNDEEEASSSMAFNKLDKSLYAPSWLAERQVAICALCLACKLSSKLQKRLVQESVITKSDNSPVSIADFAVQALVIHWITRAFPNDHFIAEEDSTALRKDEKLLKDVTDAVNSVLSIDEQLTDSEVCDLLDLGNRHMGTNERTWLLDPIDGTKGFLRGDQYCIALALLKDGAIRVGILGCPNLPLASVPPNSHKVGCIFHAAQGVGAFVQEIERGAESYPIRVSDVSDPAWATFCESWEPGHSSHELSLEIAKILGVNNPSVRMDSQCKYGVVARGEASIYFRFPKEGYQENVWDHAAGSIIIREAGGMVTDGFGQVLDFSKGHYIMQC